MTGGFFASTIGKALSVLSMPAVLLGLAACASGPVDDGAGRTIDMPIEWQSIDLAEADLTLPLITPIGIGSLGKRTGEGQVFENLYTFQGLRGYVLTSRIVFGHYTGRVSDRLRSVQAFRSFAEELSLPPGGKMTLGEVTRFQNGDPRTLGFYAAASAEPYHDRCFVARIGYLLVDYASVKREPDSVDTIVEVLLCGRLPQEPVLLEFLGSLKAVDNRAAFRRELSRRPIGTI
ncbi:MAG: hypothetical protein ACFCUW_00765 [Kiloniellaceae bacterium]